MKDAMTTGRPNAPLLRSSLIWLGVPLPIVIAMVDAYALQLFRGKPSDWEAYALYIMPTRLWWVTRVCRHSLNAESLVKS